MKQKITLLLFLTFIIFIPQAVLAQKNATISGVVTDASTGDPMYSATVYLAGTGIGAVTDMNGKYSIKEIPPGDYTLTIEYLGYEDFKKPIKVAAGKQYVENIKLHYSGGINLEGVTITAQAEGQMKAINQQMNSDNMVNVVSSERIQELPDANAAESLGRLPGVALQRSGGEGSKVVIRGMSPKYNKIMVNGVEMATSNSGDRSTDLSMISPFSLGEIEVIKSPTAEYDADFVGGLVNFKLRTAEKGIFVDALAEGTYNNLKKTYNDYNIVASAGTRFFKDKLGIFVQGNVEQRNRSSNNSSWYMDLKVPYSDSLAPYNPFERYAYLVSDVTRERKRLGGTFVVDYKIHKGRIIFSNMYTQGRSNTITQTERYNLPSYQGNHDMFLTTSNGKYKNSTLTSILKYEQSISRFNLDASVSYSGTDGDGVNRSFDSRNTVMPTVDETGIPNFYDYDPASTRTNQLTDQSSVSKQSQIEASANVEMLFNISPKVSGSIKVGGKYRAKKKSYDNDEWVADLNNHSDLRPMLREHFPQLGGKGEDFIMYGDVIDSSYTPREFMKGEFTLGPRADVKLLNDMADFIKDVYHPLYPDAMNYYHFLPASDINDYDGDEHLWAAYFLVNFKIGTKLTIIPGIRYEHNTTTYTGIFGNTHGYIVGGIYQIYDTNTYTRTNGFFLPNLQMIYQPLKWMQVRFGYTNTIARPDYGLLVPKTEITGTNNISQNKYWLEPETSTNFDLMVSFHQNYIGLISVGVFSKNIKNKIYGAPQRYMPYASEYLLDSLYNGYYITTQFNNENPTYVQGVELDIQTVFWFLPGAWKGLLINGNYTYSHSKTDYRTTRIDKKLDPETYEVTITNIDSSFVDRLANQPTHLFNISLGYDYKGFSFRGSLNFTSDMFRGYSIHPEQRTYSDKQLRLDLKVRQMLPKGFQIYANANNITGLIERDLMGTATRWPIHQEFYGTTVTLGVRWTMKKD